MRQLPLPGVVTAIRKRALPVFAKGVREWARPLRRQGVKVCRMSHSVARDGMSTLENVQD